jgi:hypothetical protein
LRVVNHANESDENIIDDMKDLTILNGKNKKDDGEKKTSYS